jgi:hypothetical protein
MVLFAAAAAASDLDLQQRVAQLEATTARSRNGPGKLTFHMYGQVNRALVFWNDGFDSGAYNTARLPAGSWQGAATGARIKF